MKRLLLYKGYCHSCVGRNLDLNVTWIPAFAGMTFRFYLPQKVSLNIVDR